MDAYIQAQWGQAQAVRDGQGVKAGTHCPNGQGKDSWRTLRSGPSGRPPQRETWWPVCRSKGKMADAEAFSQAVLAYKAGVLGWNCGHSHR